MSKQAIEELLKQSFAPVHLELQDDSPRHAKHASAKYTGGGHYRLVIVSETFLQKTPLERHRLIYKALESLQKEVHALAVTALTPQEWEAKKQ